MSNRDPFFRSVMVVADRVAVYTVLSGIGTALVWLASCRYAFGLADGGAVRIAMLVFSGSATSEQATVMVLSALVSLLGTAMVASSLFALWRRRARIEEGHVRGPRGER